MDESRSTNAAVRSYSINLIGFACGILLIIILTKLSSYLAVWKLYFSFSSFVFSVGESVHWGALLIKLSIPVISGFFIYYLPARFYARQTHGHFSEPIRAYLRGEAETTAAACGFFSALLLAWPVIAFWDLLAVRELRDKQLLFYLIYLLYFFSFAYFSLLGVKIARLGSLSTSTEIDARSFQKVYTAWTQTVKPFAMGVFTSVFATVLTRIMGVS